MRGSQYRLHSQAAAHSVRHDLHAAEAAPKSAQVAVQKNGCCSQSDAHEAFFSAEAPSGQKASLQLMAEPD